MLFAEIIWYFTMVNKNTYTFFTNLKEFIYMPFKLLVHVETTRFTLILLKLVQFLKLKKNEKFLQT